MGFGLYILAQKCFLSHLFFTYFLFAYIADYLTISTIDTKAIKTQYFDNFFDGSMILYTHNFYRFSGKTKIQMGTDSLRFYQNIVLYIRTNDDTFIEFIESKKFYPVPLWEFYNYQTGQRYATP